MSDSNNFQRWLKEVMSKIIESFGSNVDEFQYEITNNRDILMSTLQNISVKYKNKTTGQSEEHSIILKRPVQTEIVGQIVDCDSQFHNEILFYRTYSQPGENFARCFYVDERPPLDSVIALENVNERGYHHSPYQWDAPLEYTLAAMREIGRFHGKGYVMKERQREKFFDMVQQLQDFRATETYKHLVNVNATRGVEYLRRQDHDVAFCDKMDALLANAFEGVLKKLMKPLEPLSTLCHGDFTLNNVLFKTKGDGQYRAMLIDFAILRYATPAIDLTTYLYLNCSREIRESEICFSKIMRSYHDALKEYLLEAGISNIERYSYDAFLDNYKRNSLHGFLIASYFLPFLIGPRPVSLNGSQIASMGNLEFVRMIKRTGGDEISKILADMLLQLKDSGCLKDFL
ncbi:hypothetical protein P5V15_012060 [Pogonomyrmex californicus]